MDETAVIVAAIAAVPLTITAIASVLGARRSKAAVQQSAAATVSSAAAKQSSDAAALTTRKASENMTVDLLFLTRMLADHMRDNERHIDRRSVGR